MNNISDAKCAFLFRGVGNTCRDFWGLLEEEHEEILKNYCRIAQKEIGLDLENYLFYSHENTIDDPFCDWIGTYTCDCLVYKIYEQYGVVPDLMLGYSMGLITAMTCSNAISYEVGLNMLKCIYEYPIYAERVDESMAVIIGLSYKDVNELIAKNDMNSFVEVASVNNEYCIALAGTEYEIGKIMDAALEIGAINAKRVKVPYAFHSSFASIGINRYEKLVEKIHVFDSRIPIISSFDQRILKKSSDLKQELVKNMTTKMMWKDSIEKIAGLGIHSFVEVSLDDSITKFTKQIRRDLEFITYKKFFKKINRYSEDDAKVVSV